MNVDRRNRKERELNRKRIWRIIILYGGDSDS